MLYVRNSTLNNNGHIMVLASYGTSVVEWRRRVQLPRVNSLILHSKMVFLVLVYYTALTYMLSTYLDWILEQGLWKSSIICPVITEPGTLCRHKNLISFLGLQGFLIWGPPDEVDIALFGAVIHNNSVWPESRVDECPSNLGGALWLGRYYLINWGHGPGSGFWGIIDW